MSDDEPTEESFSRLIARAGRAAAGGVGKGAQVAGRAVVAVGRGLGMTTKRVWSSISVRRARRVETRIAEARTAAQVRGIEIAAESAPQGSLGPERDIETKSVPIARAEPPAVVEVVEEPPAVVEVVEEPPVEVEVVEEPLAVVEVVEEPPVEVEVVEEPPDGRDRSEVVPRTWARETVRRSRVGLAKTTRWMGQALSRAGKALGRGSLSTIRASATFSRALGGALRHSGTALGIAAVAFAGWVATLGRAIGGALRQTARTSSIAAAAFAGWVATLGRAIAAAFSRFGKSSVRGARRFLEGIGQGLRWLSGTFGRWIRKTREKWAAQPARPRMWISVGGGVAVVAGYLLAQMAVAARVAPDTTVLGVNIGGMPIEEARDVLEARFAEASSTVIRISAHDEAIAVSPQDLGLTLDVDATLDSLTGFSLSPSILWHQVVGSGPVVPFVLTDESVFDRKIGAMTTTLTRDASNAEVTLASTGAVVHAGKDAVTVNADTLAQAVLDHWLSNTLIEVPVEVAPPTLDTEEAIRFAHAFNDLVLSSSATLTSANGSVVITPEDVIAHGEIVANGSHFSLTMDGNAVSALVFERLPQVENSAVNASLAFDSAHQLYVNPGMPARTLDTAALEEAATSVVTSITREGVLPLIETPPDITVETLESSDLKALVSTFHTEFIPREPSREHNIANAAERLSGTIVEPGQEFSVTEAIGPIDRAHGYVSAGVIVGGVHTTGMGGGLCQIATTTYVAGYLAGIDIVERRPHTEWFSRYPAGRDAAIADGIDMRLRNDTPYALMFNAYVENGGLTVDIWSTPYYTVEASSSGKYNVHGGGYRTETTAPCYASSPKSGFSISDTRNVFLDGELVKSETRVSSYRAVSGIKCA